MRPILKGIRGATTVLHNDKTEILAATETLLTELVAKNQLQREHIASAFFTMTPDLNAVFPAEAARKLGWTDVALICAQEIDVPGSVPRCIRVLIHYNTHSNVSLKPVYQNEAKKLRQDLASD